MILQTDAKNNNFNTNWRKYKMKNEQNQQDIYGVLGIAPTDDFTTVKKAYIKKALNTHPDKNPGKSDEEFKIVQNAWETINSKEKLHLYFELYQQNRVDLFVENLSANFSNSSFSFPEEKNQPNNSIPSDALSEYRSGEVDVFIPVPFAPAHEPGLTQYRVDLSLDPKDQESNLENISKFIMNSNDGTYQIGVTHEEAVKIANQHSHNCMSLIVRVRLPITRLSDIRASEQELEGPYILNARATDKYFSLQPNTVINKEDIHTVQAMSPKEYQNSIRFMHLLARAGSRIEAIYSETPAALYVKGQKQNALEEVKPEHSSHTITGLHVRDNIRAGFNWLFFHSSTSSSSSKTNAEDQSSERKHYFLNNK